MSANPADGAGPPERAGGGAPVPPLPRRIDLDHAFHVYVAGRNRMWTEEEKRSAATTGAGRRAETAVSASSPGGPDRVPGPPTTGVPVPNRLAFHRSAGTWRNAVPGGPRRPGSGDRPG